MCNAGDLMGTFIWASTSSGLAISLLIPKISFFSYYHMKTLFRKKCDVIDKISILHLLVHIIDDDGNISKIGLKQLLKHCTVC